MIILPRFFVASAILAVTATLAVQHEPAAATRAAPSTPSVVLSGAHSAVTTNELRLAATQDEWLALWLRHVGREPTGFYSWHHNVAEVPEVDFEHNVVLAVFLGSTSSVARVGFHSAEQPDPDTLAVTVEAKSYQTTEKSEEVTPFGFLVLPRTGKSLVVKEREGGPGGSSRTTDLGTLDIPQAP